MTFRATVNTDRGERFKLIRSDGLALGSRLLGLLENLQDYHTYLVDPPADAFAGPALQFSQWAGEATARIANTTKILNQSWYAFDYSPDEIDAILRVLPSSKERPWWEDINRHVATRWVDTEALVADVVGLLAILSETKFKPNGWFHPEETVYDLQALLDALNLALAHHSTGVIIQFA